MKFIDISLTVSPQMAVWPGNPGVELERTRKLEDGSNANVSRLSLGVHTGTHVDAPYHFLPQGSTAETLPLDVLTGPATVIHLLDVTLVKDSDLRAALPQAVERLLIRTRNSELWQHGDSTFHQDFVGLNESAAAWLVESNIRLIGVDYLSVASFGQGTPVHRILLEAGVVIVEGLDLSAVPPGEYELWCLPVKLAGSDGAPARAILCIPDR